MIIVYNTRPYWIGRCALTALGGSYGKKDSCS